MAPRRLPLRPRARALLWRGRARRPTGRPTVVRRSCRAVPATPPAPDAVPGVGSAASHPDAAAVGSRSEGTAGGGTERLSRSDLDVRPASFTPSSRAPAAQAPASAAASSPSAAVPSSSADAPPVPSAVALPAAGAAPVGAGSPVSAGAASTRFPASRRPSPSRRRPPVPTRRLSLRGSTRGRSGRRDRSWRDQPAAARRPSTNVAVDPRAGDSQPDAAVAHARPDGLSRVGRSTRRAWRSNRRALRRSRCRRLPRAGAPPRPRRPAAPPAPPWRRRLPRPSRRSLAPPSRCSLARPARRCRHPPVPVRRPSSRGSMGLRSRCRRLPRRCAVGSLGRSAAGCRGWRRRFPRPSRLRLGRPARRCRLRRCRRRPSSRGSMGLPLRGRDRSCAGPHPQRPSPYARPRRSCARTVRNLMTRRRSRRRREAPAVRRRGCPAWQSTGRRARQRSGWTASIPSC